MHPVVSFETRTATAARHLQPEGQAAPCAVQLDNIATQHLLIVKYEGNASTSGSITISWSMPSHVAKTVWNVRCAMHMRSVDCPRVCAVCEFVLPRTG